MHFDVTSFLLFFCLLDRTLEWSNWIVTVENSNKIIANNILSEYFEEHEFRDRIVKVSLEYDHLLVAAGLQCHVYRTENLNTPAIFDLKDTLSLIVQSPQYVNDSGDSSFPRS